MAPPKCLKDSKTPQTSHLLVDMNMTLSHFQTMSYYSAPPQSIVVRAVYVCMSCADLKWCQDYHLLDFSERLNTSSYVNVVFEPDTGNNFGSV